MLYEKNFKQLSTPKPHLFIHVFDTALSCLDGFPLVSICNTTYSNSKYDRFILESHPPPLRFIQSALLFLFVCISPFQTLSLSSCSQPSVSLHLYAKPPSLPPSLYSILRVAATKPRTILLPVHVKSWVMYDCIRPVGFPDDDSTFLTNKFWNKLVSVIESLLLSFFLLYSFD